jgi:hypothetical protein
VASSLGSSRVGAGVVTVEDTTVPADVCDSTALVPTSNGAPPEAPDETLMVWPQRRQFMRTDLPAILSSAIWYFAPHSSQRNFIDARLGREYAPTRTLHRRPRERPCARLQPNGLKN